MITRRFFMLLAPLAVAAGALKAQASQPAPKRTKITGNMFTRYQRLKFGGTNRISMTVPNVPVTLLFDHPNGMMAVDKTRSSEQGYFEFTNVTPGHYWISAAGSNRYQAIKVTQLDTLIHIPIFID